MAGGNPTTQAAPQFVWEFLERGAFAAVQFVIQVALARLLSPQDFGSLAIMLAFSNVGITVVQSGLNTALIQSQDVDERDYSIVFWLSMGMAVVLFLVLFLLAPAICDALAVPSAAGPLRALSVVLPASAPASVGIARFMREMDFRSVFVASSSASVLSGAAGVLCALGGAGLWALVVQQVAYQVIQACAVMIAQRWVPSLSFSAARARELFSFGWKVAAAKLMDTGYLSVVDVVMGKAFGSVDLGLVSQGRRWPQALAYILDGSVQPVALSALSREQQDRATVKQMARKTLGTYVFLSSGAMCAVIACAAPIVDVLLGEKWLACVPYLQLYAVIYALLPLHTVNIQSVIAMGRSDIVLKLEFVKKGFGIALLAAALVAFDDLRLVVASFVVSGVVSAIVNAVPSGRLFGYTIAEQARDVVPVFLLGGLCGLATSLVSLAHLGSLSALAVQVPLFAATYLGVAALLKLPGFGHVRDLAASLIAKLRGRGE